MKNKILLSLILSIFLISFASASLPTLGFFKQGSCINLMQTCALCSYNNITSVVYPNSTQSISGEIPMTKIGTSYNYTFCNTSTLGTYIVNGHGDDNLIDTIWNYEFNVNGSGQEVTDHQITLIMITIIVMILVVIFFFVLALLFNHPGTKIFLMSLSALTLIVLIGIVASNASIYLAEFSGLALIYDNYYIFIIILAGTAMAGIIIWLIYYSFTLFNKVRGRTPDDD